MCGRYTLIHTLQEISQSFHAQLPPNLPQTTPRYNIAPTQNVVTILHEQERHLDELRWGLIPSWAKDASIGSRMINARAETLAEKPSFKRLLTGRRCLVIADGFYEWAQTAGTKLKTPMYITLKDQAPFAFAGLWDSWKNPEGEQVRTCTIITTTPNELMSSIHNRMPAILTPDARDIWLDPTIRDEQLLLHLLSSYDTNTMDARPVSRLVNDPKNDGVALIA